MGLHGVSPRCAFVTTSPTKGSMWARITDEAHVRRGRPGGETTHLTEEFPVPTKANYDRPPTVRQCTTVLLIRAKALPIPLWHGPCRQSIERPSQPLKQDIQRVGANVALLDDSEHMASLLGRASTEERRPRDSEQALDFRSGSSVSVDRARNRSLEVEPVLVGGPDNVAGQVVPKLFNLTWGAPNDFVEAVLVGYQKLL
jgi:hypothetical protein